MSNKRSSVIWIINQQESALRSKRSSWFIKQPSRMQKKMAIIRSTRRSCCSLNKQTKTSTERGALNGEFHWFRKSFGDAIPFKYSQITFRSLFASKSDNKDKTVIGEWSSYLLCWHESAGRSIDFYFFIHWILLFCIFLHLLINLNRRDIRFYSKRFYSSISSRDLVLTIIS